MVRFLGLLLTISGLVLFGITCLGYSTSLGRYQEFTPRNGELFDVSLVGKTQDMQSLLTEAQGDGVHKVPPVETMYRLWLLVAKRFSHGDQAKYSIYRNWILWSLGQVWSSVAYIRDPDELLRGHSALCDQVSYVLLALAQRAGLPVRHVGLNGHVVMEAWYENDWHMYDPDLEVVVLDEQGIVMSVEELALRPDLLSQALPKTDTISEKERIVSLFTTREDNSFVAYPSGSYFEWKSQLLVTLEPFLNIAKSVLPLILIFIGVVLLIKMKGIVEAAPKLPVETVKIRSVG